MRSRVLSAFGLQQNLRHSVIRTSSHPIVSLATAALTLTTQFSDVAALNMMKPARPFQYKTAKSISFDLIAVGVEVALTDEIRQGAYDASRKLSIALQQARTALFEQESPTDSLDVLVLSMVPIPAPRTPRDGNMSQRLEDYVRFKAFTYFLETGQLLPPSSCPYATDEEWLAGACMGLAQELQHYGLGRATARDVASVAMARDLVQEIMDQLLKFDFRNGPLRRKYDGTKYALKTLETLLYELSITGTPVSDTNKRRCASSLLPEDELDALRSRMDHRDALREALIKKCRDGQKAAKQSIFALHRGDKSQALALIKNCEACIQNDLLPIVEEEPPLRGGSFSCVMEEYAEAKLFFAWLYGKDGNGTAPMGEMLLPGDFGITFGVEEYLGGICDLTGEVGRYAVERGTARDIDSVKLARHTCGLILSALQTMQKTPGGINKKMDQNLRSVEKLERMLYEMSLSEATGRKVQTSTESMESEGTGE